ncbi:MAG TPA: XdhC/CoxI family protein [Terriglobales bacterium]|nr:XdhC/CoxI family protein [Terriglobales bacterium]
MDVYEEIVRLRREGRKGALATIVNVRGSIPSFETAKMLVRDDGSIVGTIGGGCVEAEVWHAAKEVISSEAPRTLTFDLNNDPKYDTGLVCGGTLEIFIEPVTPAPHLYIFGAGHVAFNLYKVARVAGFDVTVVDDRESYASRERFPEARDVYADDFERVMTQLAPGANSYIVVVTRGHRDDMRVLRWAVEQDARYVGMIGSRRKVIATFKELENTGSSRERLHRVAAPVGLDIGAVTPEEIAVAIVAEMIAVRRQAQPSAPRLRYYEEPAEPAKP